MVIRTHVGRGRLFVVKMNMILKARRDQVGVRSFATPTRDFLHYTAAFEIYLFFLLLLLFIAIGHSRYCHTLLS